MEHDYIEIDNIINTNLTTAEKDLITEIESALDEVAVPRVVTSTNGGVTTPGTTAVTIPINANNQKQSSHQSLDTPDILREFIDFELAAQQSSPQISSTSDSNVKAETNQLHSYLMSPIPQSSSRAPSPITKDQILDFLQDKPLSPSAGSSVGGSESGYDSMTSPRSLGSYDSCSLGSPDVTEDFDMDSFVQLFPSLM